MSGHRSLTDERCRAVAAELRRAERSAEPIRLLTERYAELTWADARTIARARDRLRVADGERLLGYKLGWTSAAMREALGIEQPNWGTLWSSHHATDARIDETRLIHPKIEPELVFHSSVDLEGAVTVEQVERSAGLWSLGLEVVDPRFPDYGFRWLDNTADNSSAARIVTGQRTHLDAPAAERVDFTDGDEHRSGTGANALGDPLAAVAWLVGSLADEGETLRAGQMVFTGGLTAPFDVVDSRRYELVSEHLAAVHAAAGSPPDL
ncbi:MAG: hypothetical protein WBL31_17875 [Ilumatobacteraceae bacterium]